MKEAGFVVNITRDSRPEYRPKVQNYAHSKRSGKSILVFQDSLRQYMWLDLLQAPDSVAFRSNNNHRSTSRNISFLSFSMCKRLFFL